MMLVPEIAGDTPLTIFTWN